MQLSRKHSILVLVVRHGEREDEAERHRVHDEAAMTKKKSSFRKASKQDRVDPKLTSLGYQLAVLTWHKVKSMLVDANLTDGIVVFSSPLRRAVGTAMMLSVVNQASSAITSTLDFTIPFHIDPDHSTSSSSSSDKTAIPIVIHNELCDCTALMVRMGGIKNVVRTGLLHCAAVHITANADNGSRDVDNQCNNNDDNSNNNNTAYSPVVWDELKCLSADIQEAMIIDDDSRTKQFSNCDFQPIRFWTTGVSGCTPISPPFHWNGSHKEIIVDVDDTTSPAAKETGTRHETIPCRFRLLQHEPPIDKAVRMATDAGCRVVLIASHREEIQYLARERCHYQPKFHAPYCTVGVFEVLLDDGKCDEGVVDKNGMEAKAATKTLGPLQWILHEVCPPEELHSQSISNMMLYSQYSSFHADGERETQWNVSDVVFDVEWPVIERTLLSLCKARLVLDGSATKNSYGAYDHLR